MESDLLSRSHIPAVQAAVEGVVESLAEVHRDGARVLLVLETFGDALRAPLPVPPPLRQWLRARTDDELGAAVQLLCDEAPSWSRPVGDEEPSPFDFALRRRDQAASALVALAWRFISAPPGTELTRRVDALDGTLRPFDLAVAARCQRAEVEALLGERRFLDDPGWRTALASDGASDVNDVEPGAEFIDGWLREGHFSRYVQRYAERDANFAARLVQQVELALRDAVVDRSLPVGFVARRWLQVRSGNARRPTVAVYADAPVALAAATEREAPERTTTHLGLLAPLPASASIDRHDPYHTLNVHAEAGALVSVSWGGVDAATPAVGEPWKVTLPVGTDALTAVITAADGARLEFDVEVAATARVTP